MRSETSTLVSIITVTYNSGSILETCINSVINQTYNNIEYIIIDGGSTDGTKEIVEKHAKYITHFISEPDKGISDAFNKGIKLASGNLIALLNSDDFYSKNSVELMVKKYIEIGRTPKTILHGDISVIYPRRTQVYHPQSLSRFSFELPIWHPTTFVSRDTYDTYLYNTDFKIAMDYELLSRAFRDGCSFIYVPAVINNMSGGGVSNTQALKGFKEVKIASIKNLYVNPLKAKFFLLYRTLLYKTMMIKRTLFK